MRGLMFPFGRERVNLRVSPKFLGAVLSGLLRLWGRTLRIRRVNKEEFDRLIRTSRPVIMLWHDEIFPLIPSHENAGLVCVVSQSRDGELLTQVLRRFGFPTARGSSSRGGTRALVAAKRLMEKQDVGAIFTVDGPRGPRHKVKPGAVFLALLAGSPVVPVRVVMEHRWILRRAWDKFQVPWPFSRCTIVYGAPVTVADPGDDPEAMRRLCEEFERIMDSLGSLS